MESIFAILVLFVSFVGCSSLPSQIHISITLDPSEMNVQWVTENKTSTSICQYGISPGKYPQVAKGNSTTYPDGGFLGFIHNVKITSLQQGTLYYYRCGDATEGWSKEWSFKTRKSNQDTVSMDAIGDMGVVWSGNTIDRMTKDVDRGEVDAVIHYGDISYADDRGSVNNSYINDLFMNLIEPIAARVPYMVSPGNHDVQFNYAAYLNRFIMPNTAVNSFWYSFDYGPVHFLSFSTEYDFSKGSVQNTWIKQDLEKAAANRKNVPWIIVFGHRPLYCSSLVAWDRCHVEAPRYRSYIEDYLLEFKVDLYMCGHNHNYERSFPVYNLTASDTSDPSTFLNPKAPIYAVCGSAGDIEFIDPTFEIPAPSWRAAVKPLEFGYCRLSANRTTLHWEFVNVNFDFGIVSDSFDVIKTVQ